MSHERNQVSRDADGILDFGQGEVKGREAIAKFISDGRNRTHYEDEMVKVNGEWLFSRRRIYNEAIPEWASRYLNPVTNPSPAPKFRAPSAPAAPVAPR